MMTIALLATLTALLTATITILCVMATHEGSLAPATVNPFATTSVADATDETMPLAAASSATLGGDWRTQELATLTQVTDMLDWLENHNITTTELTSANGKFYVRWR